MSPSKPIHRAGHATALERWLAEPLPAAPGIGPVRRAKLALVIGPTLRRRDALLHLPERLVNLTPTPGARLRAGETAAFWFEATAAAAQLGRRGRVLAGAVDSRPLQLLWFHPPPQNLFDRLAGGPALLSGVLQADRGDDLTCPHPRLHSTQDVGRRLASYPDLDRALSRRFQAMIGKLLDGWPKAEPGNLEVRHALAVLHGIGAGDAETARRQLAALEWGAFTREFSAARNERLPQARPVEVMGRLARAVERTLPFALTTSQRAAVQACRDDLCLGRATTRLVSGDVGSGKTVVAALAAADAVEAGRQALLLAPSESLAEQHAKTLDHWFGQHGVAVGLLTGSVSPTARRPLLERLRDGRLHVVVGTHALLEEAVAFHDLGLAVIDEQQRFGVRQRGLVTSKGLHPQVLTLTATPIPRTLALMLADTFAVSRLELRAGARTNVATRAIGRDREDRVLERLVAAIERGDRAFWVCSRIEGDENLPGVAERTRTFDRLLPGRVANVTGRIDRADRAAGLQAFRDGVRPLLVATTVIEVGIDVPDASIIVVDGAERFGLAQLHQLRGRVGRAGQPASCVLLHAVPLTQPQQLRLDLLRRSNDGLELAEADLTQRGPGEPLGIRQSGGSGFRVLDLDRDLAWLEHEPEMRAAFDPRALFAPQPTVTGGFAAG